MHSLVQIISSHEVLEWTCLRRIYKRLIKCIWQVLMINWGVSCHAFYDRIFSLAVSIEIWYAKHLVTLLQGMFGVVKHVVNIFIGTWSVVLDKVIYRMFSSLSKVWCDIIHIFRIGCAQVLRILDESVLIESLLAEDAVFGEGLSIFLSLKLVGRVCV